VFGFRLDESWGKAFFWTFSIATLIVFTAMFALGFEGETRRLDWTFNTAWKPMLVVEEIGMILYVISLACFALMLVFSIVNRKKNAAGPDAWGTSRTLEWLTPSPVPFYNFAVTPQVNTRDELAWRRKHGLDKAQPEHFEAIHMPSNTGMPFVIGMLAAVWGFAMIWRIWWLAAISLTALIVCVIIRSFYKNEGYHLQPEEIAAMERDLALGSVVSEQPDRSHHHYSHVEAH
jgi:cytochrome o ubiquinol oxidase subunit 1